MGTEIFNMSFAYSYEVDNSVLFYKDDYEELENDVKIYLKDIDDFIITNSSFLYSDKLVDNYDFLIYFALDYVMYNKEYYSGVIEQLDECLYINKKGINNHTFEYIKLDTIYEITDFYFGIRDFVIINDDVCINDDNVSLIDYTSDEFKFEIVDISISDSELGIDAVVSYDSGDKYLYSFDNINNVLKLKNVEVVS